MKKTIMTLVAATSLLFAACGGGNNNATSNGAATESSSTSASKAATNEPVLPVDPSAKLDKTFENSKYSLQYPSSLSPKEAFGDDDCAIKDESGYVSINGTWNTDGVNLDGWADFAANMAGAVRATDMTTETPIVKGNKFVIKATDENRVEYHYGVLKEDKVGLLGTIEFPKDKAAEYEKYVGAIINSIKFK
jgi:hypothetical protein